VTALGVLVVALLRIQPYGYNWSALIDIGRARAQQDRPVARALPAGVVLLKGEHAGYDGYYYFRTALDPFFQDPGFRNLRAQRYLYPLASYVLAGGQGRWIPFTLFAVNLLAAVLGAAVVAWMCAERGVSPWWSLCFSLSAGNVLAVVYDLTSPLCLAFAAAAMWCQLRRRIVPCAVFYALAIMTRESAVLLIAPAVLYEWWGRRWRDGLIVGLSVVPMVIWQAVLTPILGCIPWLASTGKGGVPLAGVYGAIRLLDGSHGAKALIRTAGPLAMFVMAMWGTVLAIRRLWGGASLFALGMCGQGLLAVLMGVPQWDSFLGATRILSAVFLFAVLMHAEQPRVATRWLLVAAAALSVTPLVRVLWFSPVWPYDVVH